MSDRAALLAAICAHPDEDTPRLVYADWLDEHGEGKRAAAIRAAVAHHRLSTADTAAAVVGDFFRTGLADSRGSAVRHLARFAFAGNFFRTTFAGRLDWAGIDADLGASRAAERVVRACPLTLKGDGVPRVPWASFHSRARGFFDGVCISDPDSFLERAGPIFRAAPITGLWFQALTAEQATRFVAAGHLARVRELILDSRVEADAIRILGTHPDAAGVRKLVLIRWGFARQSLDALAAGPHWTGLDDLDVSDVVRPFHEAVGPSDGQLAAVFARPQFRALRRLSAWGSRAGDRAVRAIARNLPELRVLDLASNLISARGWAALAASKTLTHLRHLDLDSCETEGADPAPLITAPNLPNLTVLLLGRNDLSGTSPKALARSGRGPGLRVLTLDRTNLTAAAAAALAACPAAPGLWFLDLNGLGLDDGYLERFLARAAFERLTCLNLSHNALTARGARALAEWPGAASLQWLSVSGNAIGPAGAKALAASSYLKNLKAITASGRGVAVLKKRFKKGLVE